MTKYQEWKLYRRYVLRRISKRIRPLLSRVFPQIVPAGKKSRIERGVPLGAK
jgi:hypothetical protein